VAHENIGAAQLNTRAGSVVQHQVDLVGPWRALHQDVQLLEDADTRIVVLTSWDNDAEYALFVRAVAVGLRR
jgi:hypothetical protein